MRIKRGPLRNLEGQLVRFKAGPRLVISVGLLAKSVAVEVDTQDVEVICQDGRRVALGHDHHVSYKDLYESALGVVDKSRPKGVEGWR